MRLAAIAVLLLAMLGVGACCCDKPVRMNADTIDRKPSDAWGRWYEGNKDDIESLKSVLQSTPTWANVSQEQMAAAMEYRVPVAFENNLGMRFVLIPAGTFLMGSPEDEEGYNKSAARHQVTIAQPFYMATTETTQAVWEKVMARNPSTVKGAALPVKDVFWDDCQTFVKRLNETVAPAYRLPTEAEWEYACRAGTTTRFWSGDTEEDLDRVAWYFRNSGNQRLPQDAGWRNGKVLGAWACRTHAVGGKPANPWGLHDMYGNVPEWCEDSWQYSYEGAPDDGSARVDQGSGRRVLRGGSWDSEAKFARSAFRCGVVPGSFNVGFRLVRAVTPKVPPTTAPFVSPQVPDPVSPGIGARPEDVVRLWLEATKRGDAEAMAALWAAEKRAPVKSAPKMRRAEVASGTLHAALWEMGASAGEDDERTVTVHVVWREPHLGGDNLRFHFVQRDGRWWIVSIWDYD